MTKQTRLSHEAREQLNRAYRELNKAQGAMSAAKVHLGSAVAEMRAARNCQESQWSDYLRERLGWAIDRAEAAVDSDAYITPHSIGIVISLVCDVCALSMELQAS